MAFVVTVKKACTLHQRRGERAGDGHIVVAGQRYKHIGAQVEGIAA